MSMILSTNKKASDEGSSFYRVDIQNRSNSLVVNRSLNVLLFNFFAYQFRDFGVYFVTRIAGYYFSFFWFCL